MEHPDRSLRIIWAMLACLIVPVTLTLLSIDEVTEIVTKEDDPTPYGYTWSLTIFLIPLIAIAIWFATNRQYKIEAKAFMLTAGGVLVMGTVLDIMFGYLFFRFPDPHSALGIWLPAFGWTDGWVWGYLPIEEFLFYILGGLVMTSLYVWGDTYWFNRYSQQNHKILAAIAPRFSFHVPTALIGFVAIGVAWLYKKYGNHPYNEGFPGYFAFLVLMAILPTMSLYKAAKDMINWRAFAFMYSYMLLVSLMWEATLALQYGWWNYKTEQMMGLMIKPWWDLPVEAVMLWFAAAWGPVVTYSVLRVKFHQKAVKLGLIKVNTAKAEPNNPPNSNDGD